MPTYGYRCGSCGHEFEIRQRITDEALVACPKCGGKLAKMVYPAGVIFTGSGYYTTDYKGSSQGSEASSSNGVAPASEGSSESKPETKSESKSESKSEAKAEPKSKSKSETKSESKSGSTDKKGS
jgi:putative FmdB family regulatory protein